LEISSADSTFGYFNGLESTTTLLNNELPPPSLNGYDGSFVLHRGETSTAPHLGRFSPGRFVQPHEYNTSNSFLDATGPLHHPRNRYAVTGGALRRFLVETVRGIQFARALPLEQIAQEIRMFFDGIVSRRETAVTITDDRVLRDAKGFGNCSFKSCHLGKKLLSPEKHPTK
jgi:hypothetical protein